MWLLALLLLLPFTGCQTQLTANALEIHPLAAPAILAPDRSYTFTFTVSDRTTQQLQAAIPVEALLTLDNGTVLQLFHGRADAQGQVTFTYQTPYRQPAGMAKLSIQAQSATGPSEFQTAVELLPALLIRTPDLERLAESR